MFSGLRKAETLMKQLCLYGSVCRSSRIWLKNMVVRVEYEGLSIFDDGGD